MLKRLGSSTSIEGSNGVVTIPSPSPDGPPVIDLTFSGEDTLELPPSSPVVEVVDTNACAKARFPDEIPGVFHFLYLSIKV